MTHEEEIELGKEMAQYAANPWRFVMDMFPCDSHPELKGAAPEKWQREVLEAIRDGLPSGRSISIPEDCRSLVERATHADYLRELGASLGVNWTDLWRELFDDAAMKAQLAEASLIDWERPYCEALVNEWLPTRLGEGTVTVAVKNLVSPFTGQEIEALPIPGWLRGVALPDEPINAVNQQLRIGTQNYAYDRLGIRRLSD